jgi:hypothetical protein
LRVADVEAQFCDLARGVAVRDTFPFEPRQTAAHLARFLA